MLRKEHELHKRRRARNLAMLALLGGFVLLIFTVTIVKLGENAANPWG
jgi:hypothetical protein